MKNIEEMTNVELKTQRLNKLKIKESLYTSNNYDVPQYILDEIKILTNELNSIKDIVEKVDDEASGLITNKN
jgi:hypothetical protein